MRRYEMMVILRDTLDDDGAQALLERIQTVVGEQGGTVLATDWWGKRPLAYEIDHRSHAYYVVLDLEIANDGLTELERQLKIHDDVVRFKTIRPQPRIRSTA